MKRKIAARLTIRFYLKDFWIIETARRKAKIKGISVSEELIDNARKIYMLERRQSGKKVQIDEYLFNIMELQAKEYIKLVADRENKKEGILDG